MRIRATDDAIYRLKVSLRGVRPPIWRRFLVPAGITLRRLHDCLQEVMGWTQSHLHQFEAGGVIYGTPDLEFGVATISESRARLDQLLRRPKDRLTYEYDFGDSWEHDVVLESILPPAPAARYPIVEDGKRACPPEDCGGPYGYLRFLEIIADPRHPEHEEMLEWAGGDFDPEAFEVPRTKEARRARPTRGL
ncbi:MAG: plasmid pRiA4b ORF-3 family protein [Gammaproteobacteria bacterium]|nr:MAG: plasmid pRiA4b ORF-3 family protein [Gammaproteobacteria bacterium]